MLVFSSDVAKYIALCLCIAKAARIGTRHRKDNDTYSINDNDAKPRYDVCCCLKEPGACEKQSELYHTHPLAFQGKGRCCKQVKSYCETFGSRYYQMDPSSSMCRATLCPKFAKPSPHGGCECHEGYTDKDHELVFDPETNLVRGSCAFIPCPFGSQKLASSQLRDACYCHGKELSYPYSNDSVCLPSHPRELEFSSFVEYQFSPRGRPEQVAVFNCIAPYRGSAVWRERQHYGKAGNGMQWYEYEGEKLYEMHASTGLASVCTRDCPLGEVFAKGTGGGLGNCVCKAGYVRQPDLRCIPNKNYVWVEAWNVAPSGVIGAIISTVAYHTEVSFCSASGFTAEQQQGLDEYAKKHAGSYTTYWQRTWSTYDAACTSCQYGAGGGIYCHPSSINRTRSRMGNAAGTPTKYLYGSVYGIDPQEVVGEMRHCRRGGKAWAGGSYDFLSYNCNLFTMHLLGCELGLSHEIPGFMLAYMSTPYGAYQCDCDSAAEDRKHKLILKERGVTPT